MWYSNHSIQLGPFAVDQSGVQKSSHGRLQLSPSRAEGLQTRTRLYKYSRGLFEFRASGSGCHACSSSRCQALTITKRRSSNLQLPSLCIVYAVTGTATVLVCSLFHSSAIQASPLELLFGAAILVRRILPSCSGSRFTRSLRIALS